MSRLEKAREFRKQILANVNATRKLIRVDELSEEELLDMIDLYENYEIDKLYKVDDIFKYEGKLYKVIQEHISAEWDFDRDLAANPIQPGEHVIWTDGKVYESIHPTPHAWSPEEYPQAWKLIE